MSSLVTVNLSTPEMFEPVNAGASRESAVGDRRAKMKVRERQRRSQPTTRPEPGISIAGSGFGDR
jgi:hypothetical protein